MDLTPDSDQQAFVAATADWCRDNLPWETVRSRPQSIWHEIEAMGWIGMTSSDMGLDHATEALVFAELGRHLAPVGMLSSAVVSRSTGSAGKTALALTDEDDSSGKVRIFDPVDASRALGLIGSMAAIMVLPPGIAASPGLDQTVPMACIGHAPAFTSLRDPVAPLHLQLLAAAFAVGTAETACDMAAGYAKLREQFERPIGWFQALKHICADMAVRAEVARSQMLFAACALDAGSSDAAFQVASAKQLADHAAIENGRANIQVHGGIGMTDEAYPHFCLKRAHLLSFIAPAQRSILLGEAA